MQNNIILLKQMVEQSSLRSACQIIAHELRHTILSATVSFELISKDETTDQERTVLAENLRDRLEEATQIVNELILDALVQKRLRDD